jgi:hypothetical protein
MSDFDLLNIYVTSGTQTYLPFVFLLLVVERVVVVVVVVVVLGS